MRRKLLVSMFAVLAVTGLTGCDGDSPTEPSSASETPTIELSRLYANYPFGDSAIVRVDQLNWLEASITARNMPSTVFVKVYFIAENGDKYENATLSFGPYEPATYRLIQLDIRFRVRDGLLEFSRGHAQQAIGMVARVTYFHQGVNKNWDLPLLKFYVSE